jgi:predicted transposase YdaD
MKESVIYQDIEAQGFTKGFTEGFEQKRLDIALNLIRGRMSIDFIANVTNLTVEKVQQLQNSQQSNQ